MAEDGFDFIKDLENRGEKARKDLEEKLRKGGRRVPPVRGGNNPYGIEDVDAWHKRTEASKEAGIDKSQPTGDKK